MQDYSGYKQQARDGERDGRGRTTGWIWFWATLMMGPAVAIVLATGSSLFPLCVLGGAALSTVCVWGLGAAGSGHGESQDRALQEAAAETLRLKAQLEAMEERLQALETIRSYEQARHERTEQARFGSPHEGSLDSALDPLHASPSSTRSTNSRTPGERAAES